MYYGSASERDMDFYQFVVMFKSIFMEGFAKPVGGMHYILNLLVDKYKSLGGELKMGAEVQFINSERGEFKSLTLVSGEQLTANAVISSMGRVETLKRCDPVLLEEVYDDSVGQVSFMESLFALDREPKDIGYSRSIVFFCTENRFHYEVPTDLIDVSSGVLCCPNNFKYPKPLPEGMIRLTNLANFGVWNILPRRKYIDAKKEWRTRALENLFTFFPDFRDSVVFSDSFTQKTTESRKSGKNVNRFSSALVRHSFLASIYFRRGRMFHTPKLAKFVSLIIPSGRGFGYLKLLGQHNTPLDTSIRSVGTS
jgi:phytoene dehydrogenase-like protein